MSWNLKSCTEYQPISEDCCVDDTSNYIQLTLNMSCSWVPTHFWGLLCWWYLFPADFEYELQLSTNTFLRIVMLMILISSWLWIWVVVEYQHISEDCFVDDTYCQLIWDVVECQPISEDCCVDDTFSYIQLTLNMRCSWVPEPTHFWRMLVWWYF